MSKAKCGFRNGSGGDKKCNAENFLGGYFKVLNTGVMQSTEAIIGNYIYCLKSLLGN